MTLRSLGGWENFGKAFGARRRRAEVQNRRRQKAKANFLSSNRGGKPKVMKERRWELIRRGTISG
jgi:hypothetical protein